MKDILRLIRLDNLLFIAIILGVMEYWVARPVMLHYQLQQPLTWWMLTLLIVATVLIAAGGYVINDYFDVKIDAINRPEDLVVTRSVTKEQAMRLFQILTATGIACGIALAVILRSMALGCTFIFVPGILWFYSASYKRQFLVGNLCVSFLAGLTPLLVGLACDAAIKKEFGTDSLFGLMLSNTIITWVAGFAGFAFLCTWIREVVKDIEDQEGDRELECHTFPVKYGNLASKIFVTVLVVLTMAAMSWINFGVLAIPFSWGSFTTRFYLLLMIGMICVLALLWAAKLKSDYHHCQQLVKLVMFLGTMYAFCVNSLL